MEERLNVIEILLAEDNPGDARLTEMALTSSKIRNRLHVVGNGEEAMAFLARGEGYEDAARPDLILLDLNMPRMDGREVLAEIKEHPDLRRIPVVILTSSDAEQDVLSAYDLHANAYVTKPVDLQRFLEIVQQIEHFWLTIVELPRG